MRVDHARDSLTPNMDWVKAKVFEHDVASPLVFHRKDILGYKGPYEILRDQKYDRSPFNGYIVGYGIKHLPR